MGLIERGGTWHYRFKAIGRRWSGSTGLAATERNRSAALLKEAAARKEVLEGRGEALRLEVRTFSDAAASSSSGPRANTTTSRRRGSGCGAA